MYCVFRLCYSQLNSKCCGFSVCVLWLRIGILGVVVKPFMFHMIWMGVLGYCGVVLGKVSSFGISIGYKACSYGLIVEIEWMGMFTLYFGMILVYSCVWPETKPCKFRPSESRSPKRELQNLVSSFGSRFSLGRSVSGLSDLVSRLGDNGSSKRGRDETCTC